MLPLLKRLLALSIGLLAVAPLRLTAQDAASSSALTATAAPALPAIPAYTPGANNLDLGDMLCGAQKVYFIGDKSYSLSSSLLSAGFSAHYQMVSSAQQAGLIVQLLSDAGEIRDTLYEYIHLIDAKTLKTSDINAADTKTIKLKSTQKKMQPKFC